MTNGDYIVHMIMFVGILLFIFFCNRNICIIHNDIKVIMELMEERQEVIIEKKNDNMAEIWIHGPAKLFIELDPNMEGNNKDT